MNSAVQFAMSSWARLVIAALAVLASVSTGRVVADSRPSFLILFADVSRDWGFKLGASRSSDSAGARAHDAGVSLVRRW